jgi:hypothetical protein
MRNLKIRETFWDEVARIMQIIRETGEPQAQHK